MLKRVASAKEINISSKTLPLDGSESSLRPSSVNKIKSHQPCLQILLNISNISVLGPFPMFYLSWATWSVDFPINMICRFKIEELFLWGCYSSNSLYVAGSCLWFKVQLFQTNCTQASISVVCILLRSNGADQGKGKAILWLKNRLERNLQSNKVRTVSSKRNASQAQQANKGERTPQHAKSRHVSGIRRKNVKNIN